jgi:hypothetical protein
MIIGQCDYCSKPACAYAQWSDGTQHAACSVHLFYLHCWSLSVQVLHPEPATA